jgi:hypothetical protein
MKKHILLPLIINLIFLFFANAKTSNNEDIILENEQVKLVIGSNGIAQSLIYKPTGEECLDQGQDIPVFSVTQERPFHNEIKLAYPTKMMTFDAKSVLRKGNELIVDFEFIFYKARIKVDVTPQYINFTVKEFFTEGNDYGIGVNSGILPPVYEMNFIQLPVKNRAHFGEWLNVSWDDKIAVSLLATDIHARIDAEKREGYRVMNAAVERDIQLLDVGAALIVCKPNELLDNIARVEEDFGLPRGAASRRHELYNSSYYAASDITPDNVDEHIKYAKMGGFRTMKLSYDAVVESGPSWSKKGNYDWRRDLYPNGREDLKKLLKRIKSQGIATGLHFLHSHVGRDSRYVTPIPDHRLNLLKYFTLSQPMGMNDTEIFVEQNPKNTTMADGMRVLKVGTELISYKGYTTAWPYKFIGCERGVDSTTVNSQPKGNIIGLLDVSEFGWQRSVYVDQNTSLQDEIAEKLADIYNTGFEFCYFDGSEGVNPPFWFNVPYAQWKVYKRFDPKPVFAEGAAKSHFSWHMLSGGNAFDVFMPDILKEEIKRWPAQQAERMKADFSRVNFGWLGYFVPNEESVGTQPDMIEFVTSLAAAWDCPVSLNANLDGFKTHARTSDNLEVYRRWEEVRAKNWLTDKQKKMLQNVEQEHILLENEQKEFELIPYNQITDVANRSRDVRAFIFERGGEWYVVYWHISGSKNLELPLSKSNVKLYETLDKEAKITNLGNNTISVPVSGRRYLKGTKAGKEELINSFRNAKIID